MLSLSCFAFLSPPFVRSLPTASKGPRDSGTPTRAPSALPGPAGDLEGGIRPVGGTERAVGKRKASEDDRGGSQNKPIDGSGGQG